MRTLRTSEPLARVLAQVERGQHAERRHREAGEQHHQHGAEDRGEDAALGVRLARLAGRNSPEPRGVQRRACRPTPSAFARTARTTCASGIAFSRPSAVRMTSVVGEQLRLARGALGRRVLVARLQRGRVALCARAARSISRFSSRISASQRVELARALGALRAQQRGQRRPAPRRAPSASDALAAAHRDRVAVEAAPLLALEHAPRPRGSASLFTCARVDPAEVRAAEIAVADRDAQALARLALLVDGRARDRRSRRAAWLPSRERELPRCRPARSGRARVTATSATSPPTSSRFAASAPAVSEIIASPPSRVASEGHRQLPE